MIGVFDSGFGGLTILRALHAAVPDQDFVYLGDNARAPYGARSPEEILAYTWEAVSFLFENGCDLVILGCNTASANALRRIQQERLHAYPGKRVLGILVPTVEQMTGVPWAVEACRTDGERMHVAIFATPATVASGAYSREVQKRCAHVQIAEIACPTLVPLIESGADEMTMRRDIAQYVRALPWQPDVVLLGCTHYPLVRDLFHAELPEGLLIYDQPMLVADRFSDYLKRHPEYARTGEAGKIRFLTTADAHLVSALGSRFFGKPITFETVQIAP